MSVARRRSTVNSTPRGHTSGWSIGEKVFISTLSLVVVTLLVTTLVYLIVFSEASRNLTEDQSVEINKQIVFNFDRYVASVIETANYLQLAVGTYDVERDRQSLKGIFDLNQEIKQDVVSIFLFDDGGAPLLGGDLRIPVPLRVSETDWFLAATRRPEIYHFFVGMSANTEIDRNDRVITVSRRVSYYRDGTSNTGVLLVELNIDAITQLSERTNLGEFGHILIINERDELIYASARTPYSEASYDVAARLYLGGFPTRVQGLDMYLHTNSLPNTRWRITTVSNIDQVIGARRRVLYIMVAIGLVSLAVTALVAALISVHISRPINTLRGIMAEIEGGELDTPVQIDGQREIVELSASFAQMVNQIRELMTRLVTEQREKRKTELRALQNQINPHFLYNTLDSIVWLAEHGRSEDVVTSVVALAKFFRISISKGDTFIPVAHEIEHVENYLTIQKTRYVDKFAYRIAVAPEIFELKVMKLILQPLVENAIYHGMGDETGLIEIRGGRRAERVYFEVENSGYGLTEEKIREMEEMMRGVRPGSSVGLRNVYQRLKLYYGEEAEVKVSSVIDESTTITLVIPAERPGG